MAYERWQHDKDASLVDELERASIEVEMLGPDGLDGRRLRLAHLHAEVRYDGLATIEWGAFGYAVGHGKVMLDRPEVGADYVPQLQRVMPIAQAEAEDLLHRIRRSVIAGARRRLEQPIEVEMSER